MKKIFSKKDKDEQIKKENKISIALYLSYFIWWYVTGYGLSKINISVFHLPLWFFLSSIFGYIFFCILTIIIVKFQFKNFDLKDNHE